jgi:hypothetical protein
MTTAYSFQYVHSDIPAGMTLGEYRALRHPRRRRLGLWRFRRRCFDRLSASVASEALVRVGRTLRFPLV